jgi:hypothetical protein
MAVPREPPAPAAYAHRPGITLLPRAGQAVPQMLQTPLPAVALGLGRVPAHTALPPSGRNGQPGFDPADAGLQAQLLRGEVPFRQPHLVLGRAGDRPGPPGRRQGSELPLSLPA